MDREKIRQLGRTVTLIKTYLRSVPVEVLDEVIRSVVEKTAEREKGRYQSDNDDPSMPSGALVLLGLSDYEARLLIELKKKWGKEGGSDGSDEKDVG